MSDTIMFIIVMLMASAFGVPVTLFLVAGGLSWLRKKLTEMFK